MDSEMHSSHTCSVDANVRILYASDLIKKQRHQKFPIIINRQLER